MLHGKLHFKEETRKERLSALDRRQMEGRGKRGKRERKKKKKVCLLCMGCFQQKARNMLFQGMGWTCFPQKCLFGFYFSKILLQVD